MKILLNETGMIQLRCLLNSIIGRFLDINMFPCTVRFSGTGFHEPVGAPAMSLVFKVPITGTLTKQIRIFGDISEQGFYFDDHAGVATCEHVSVYILNELLQSTLSNNERVCFHIEPDININRFQRNNKLFVSVEDGEGRIDLCDIELQKSYFNQASRNFWEQMQ